MMLDAAVVRIQQSGPLLRRAAMWCVLVGAVLQVGLMLFAQRWQIGISPQTTTSLPWRWMLAERQAKDSEAIQRNEIRQFVLPESAIEIAPAGRFPRRALFTKVVAGVPGDRFSVGADGRVLINGQFWGAVDGRVLASLGRTAAQTVVDGVVPDRSYFMIGSAPRSFDSRYFGPVPEANLRGLAWPLF